MTSDTAIPTTVDPTRSATRLYFRDATAFGSPQARPAVAPTPDRRWDDDQLLAAAHAGAAGEDLHPDILAALCRRYVDLVQAEVRADTAECRVAELLLVLGQERAARQRADKLHTAELAETLRLAKLHAEASAQLAWTIRQHAVVSYENKMLRHQIDGTTPVDVQIALDAVTDSDHDDRTVVVDAREV